MEAISVQRANEINEMIHTELPDELSIVKSYRLERCSALHSYSISPKKVGKDVSMKSWPKP